MRRLDVAPVQIRRIAAHGEVEFRREPLPQRREDESKRRIGSHSARSGRERDTTCTIGHVTADTRRLSGSGPLRQPHRAARQRLHQTRDDVRVRPVQAVEQLAAVRRGAEREHGAAVAIPRAHERFADSLSPTLGRDHGIASPRALDFDSLDRYADRQRRVVPDDRRAFARDPDLRLPVWLYGLRRCCQSQRRRSALAASAPCVRR